MTRSDWRFRAFTLLYALSVLFQQAGYGMLRQGVLDAALAVASIAVLVRPASNGLLLTMAALRVGSVVVHLPAVYNHWWPSGLAAVGLLASAPSGGRHRRGADAEPLIGALRACLVLVNLPAGCHKLNTDFLSSA